MTEASNRQGTQVKWALADDQMGTLERAGLAGLALSCTAADERSDNGDDVAKKLKKRVSWDIEDKTLALYWDCDDEEALTALIAWAWQVRDDIYYLPGIHRGADSREHAYLRLNTHLGLTGTFLQIGAQHKPKAGQSISCLVRPDEEAPEKTIAIRYRPFLNNPEIRQLVAFKNKKFLPFEDKNGSQRIISNLPSWLYPGAAKRFGGNELNWTGPASTAFLLLFAPIACLYLRLPRSDIKKHGGMRQNWAFMVPEVRSLREVLSVYPRIQADVQLRFDRVGISTLGEAALMFAVAYAGRTVERRLHSPEVWAVAMGETNYYSSSPTVTAKIRKQVLRITPSSTSIEKYSRLINAMPNSFRRLELKAEGSETAREDAEKGEPEEEKATYWVYQPTARGRIADNLVKGDPWYKDILVPPLWQMNELENQRKRRSDGVSAERLWFENMSREKEKLMDLASEDEMWGNPAERAFFDIFHKALRMILNKEDEALSRGGSASLPERWDRRREDIRRSLMHAKTRPLVRKCLTELLAESEGSKELTQHQAEVWRLINDPYEWEKARDLALLALVTFTDKRLAKKKGSVEKEGAV